MASVYEKLVTERTAQATLYDPGETNPRSIGLLVSNTHGLGTERVVSDFTFGWVDWGTPIAPGQTAVWNGERYLFVKTVKGALPLMAAPPVKVQLLHLVANCPHYRGGVPQTAVVRMVPEVSVTLKSETEIPLDRVHIITPLGTDLRVNDTLVWDGWLWFLRDVLPGSFDGHYYAVTADIIRLGYVAGPQDFLFTNATVLRYRGDDTDAAPLTLRCRWYEPMHDRITEDGQVISPAVFFPMESDVMSNDLIKLVSLDMPDGTTTALDSTTWWHVRLAAHEGQPLPVIRCVLEGGDQYA